MRRLAFILAQFGVPTPDNWSAVVMALCGAGGLLMTVFTIWQAARAKNRSDAIEILKDQVKELRKELDELKQHYEKNALELTETNRQLNERTLELASARVDIGRLHLQRDEREREVTRVTRIARHFRDLATVAQAMFPDQFSQAKAEQKRRNDVKAAEAAAAAQQEKL